MRLDSDDTASRPSEPASPLRRFPREQRNVILNGILCLVGMLCVLQLWLFTATVNAWLGGDGSVVWPAALASLACLGLNAGLLKYLYGLEEPR